MNLDLPACTRCQHFSRPHDDRLVQQSGFGRCAHLPVGHYRAPRAHCAFTPSRFRAVRHA